MAAILEKQHRSRWGWSTAVRWASRSGRTESRLSGAGVAAERPRAAGGNFAPGSGAGSSRRGLEQGRW